MALARMRSPRYLFASAVLPGGRRVIVAGGCNPAVQCKPIASAEIFDLDAGPYAIFESTVSATAFDVLSEFARIFAFMHPVVAECGLHFLT